MACIVLAVIIVMSIDPRRRARPEGRPDDHHLHAAARVVLLLPVRAAARRSSRRARVPRDDRHPDDLPGPAARCCRSSTAAPSATRRAGRSRRSRGITTIGAMAYLSILGAHRRLADRDRAATSTPQYEKGRDVAAVVRLHRLPHDRRERQPRARARPHRRSARACPRRRSRARSSTRRRRCRRTPICSRRSRTQLDRVPLAARRSDVAGRIADSNAARSPDAQVRAMFDRIAGVYDLMNSVMTAGMHHRWRERAAELARVGPGSRALDVATGTGDLAVALRARRRARSSAATSPRRCSSRRGRKEPAARFEWADALELPYEDDSFDAATVGFGARNFSDLERGLGRDGPGRAPRRPRRGARDHDAAEAAAVDRSSRSGSTASCRSRPPGGRRGRLLVPAELGQALPGPRGARAAELADAGLEDIRWVLTAGGIIAIHAGTVSG